MNISIQQVDILLAKFHDILKSMGFFTNKISSSPSDGDCVVTSSSYRLDYLHPSCPVSTLCFVIYTPLVNSLILSNFAVKIKDKLATDHAPISFVFSLTEYVRSESNGELCLQHEDKLYRSFRDKLALPALATMQSGSGRPQSLGIMTLPLEVLHVLLYYMPVQHVISLSLTCHLYHNLIHKTNTIWMMLVKRDFPNHTTNTNLEHVDWKQIYVSEYTARARLDREKRRRMISPDIVFPPRLPPPHPVIPFVPPGFIGGDIDRDPIFRDLVGDRRAGPSRTFPPRPGRGFFM